MSERPLRKKLPQFLPEPAPLNRPKAVEIRFELMGYELLDDTGPTPELTVDSQLKPLNLPNLRGQDLLDWAASNAADLGQADAYLLLRNRDAMLNGDPELRKKIIHFFGTRWKDKNGLIFIPTLFCHGSNWRVRLTQINASRSPKDVALSL